MGITVEIVASKDESQTKVSASGSVQDIVSDTERTSFGLDDKTLKKAVGAYFGKEPNDAYLHSDTPWGDLYKSYGWDQVTRVLHVTGAKVLGVTSKPEVVATEDFVNNSGEKGDFNVTISQSVTESATSSWSTGGTLTVGQSFKYGVEFLGTGASGTTSISYSQSWGVGGSHTEEVTLGKNAGVTVSLDPGQKVKAQLTASRGTLKVRVEYEAYLSGLTAVNYDPAYKGHHFWGLDIGAVMSAGGIKNSITSTEDIEIGFYADGKITLLDGDNSVTYERSLVDRAGH